MTDLLEQAHAAYARRDWPRAREFYSAARAQDGVSAHALYQLADAAWWLGDNAEFFEACEQAYRLYVQEGRPRRAAIAALDIAVAHFLRGEEAVASGWMSRARRLLENEAEAAEHGYLVYLHEVEGPLSGIDPAQPAAIEALGAAARRVREIGRRHADPTLVALGILGEGRCLVRAGRVSEGMALLDEAMLAVLTDELHPAWSGNIYCHLMSAAEELGDLRRAREWTHATTRWLAGFPAGVIFSGICRVYQARVHQRAGAWEQAEAEAARVCSELEDLHASAAAEARYQLGELRRLRSDVAGAEEAFQQAHALGRDPQPGLALLHLARGGVEAAAVSIGAAVVAEKRPLSRAGLLAAQVEIALAAGDLEEARQASDELTDIAARYGSYGLAMADRYARGAVLLHEGRLDDALPILREACRGWSEVDAPYDCARVRVLLAETYRRLGDHDAAGRELAAAASAFEQLGATTDFARVARLAGNPDLPAGLTPREAQVLALVAEGKTNRAVARELTVSEKTVARHLSNIFGKLGVTSRTAAAAFAFEQGLAPRASQ